MVKIIGKHIQIDLKFISRHVCLKPLHPRINFTTFFPKNNPSSKKNIFGAGFARDETFEHEQGTFLTT